MEQTPRLVATLIENICFAGFAGKSCPDCGMKCWNCFECGYRITAATATNICPRCGTSHDFVKLPYYIKEKEN